ncbi:MAG TPA: phenylalanine--tRNA ligase subunit beta [Actinomycetota bacterium]|nr:phenylalanine--tRNA ligase subunit beta [Actinomycetota bacterium]
MRVPLGWLREHCAVDLAPEELGDLLALKGLHVEAIERPWDGLEGVVVARVLDVRDHPNSTKLCLASIDAGQGPVQVVVGVRNMAAGDLVPWARPGSRVPVLDQPLEAKALRGEESNGMLCSPRELAISQEHESGILLLPADLSPGADVKTSLGLDDVVLDLEIESNRPDLLSIVGVAREVAAATGVPRSTPDTSVDEDDAPANGAATVEIEDPKGCPRYLARAIIGAGEGRTPLAVQARLTACGTRPISPIVDATNYAMLELGQPLHAFDLRRLAGPGIVVRRSGPGERVETLDGVDRELDDDLLICDLEEPVAIAGVMGGASSEVGPDTTDVLLESAYFEPRSILRTSRRLQLLTEASVRFSRGTDPEGVGPAAARAARLIAEWTGARVLSGAIDAGSPTPRRRLSLRAGRATAVLGYPVSPEAAAEALAAIEIAATTDGDVVHVEAPSFRPDLEREEDLIEEIVRVHGYDRLPSTVPPSRRAGGEQDTYRTRRRLRELLVRAGLRDSASLTFASAAEVELFGGGEPVRVANPPSAEEPYLRTSLLPKLLEAASRNGQRGARTVALSEIGHVFRLGDPVVEREHLAFVLTGLAGDELHSGDRAFDVADAKGIVELVLRASGIDAWLLEPGAERPFHPGRSGGVLVGDRRVGTIGELHPADAARLDLTGRVALAELDVTALQISGERSVTFRDVPRFPPVRRDLAFAVPIEVPVGDVHAALVGAGGPLLDRATLFDVFRGGAIAEDRKSLAFALEFRAPDRTLTDQEVEPVVGAIVERLRSAFGAELRA